MRCEDQQGATTKHATDGTSAWHAVIVCDRSYRNHPALQVKRRIAERGLENAFPIGDPE
jgi:hypothetical protein